MTPSEPLRPEASSLSKISEILRQAHDRLADLAEFMNWFSEWARSGSLWPPNTIEEDLDDDQICYDDVVGGVERETTKYFESTLAEIRRIKDALSPEVRLLLQHLELFRSIETDQAQSRRSAPWVHQETWRRLRLVCRLNPDDSLIRRVWDWNREYGPWQSSWAEGAERCLTLNTVLQTPPDVRSHNWTEAFVRERLLLKENRGYRESPASHGDQPSSLTVRSSSKAAQTDGASASHVSKSGWDLTDGLVRFNGQILDLTRRQADLVRFLAQAPDQTAPTGDAIDHMRKCGWSVEPRSQFWNIVSHVNTSLVRNGFPPKSVHATGHHKECVTIASTPGPR